MDKIRFQIARLADCCYDRRSNFRQYVHRSVNRASRHRPLYFAYAKVTICTLTILFLAIPKSPGGITRSTCTFPRQAFLIVLLAEWILGVVLIFGYKKKNASICLTWCILQIIALVLVLLLTLSEEVRIELPGAILLGLASLFKIYGLYLIFYFYLHLRNSTYTQSPKMDNYEDQDPFHITYFNSRRSPKSQQGSKQEDIDQPKFGRRGTDTTSICSSDGTLSPTVEGVRRARKSDSIGEFSNASADDPFRLHFFPAEAGCEISSNLDTNADLKYTEVEIICEDRKSLGNQEVPGISDDTLRQNQHENSRFSNLMCGGVSTINVEK